MEPLFTLLGQPSSQQKIHLDENEHSSCKMLPIINSFVGKSVPVFNGKPNGLSEVCLAGLINRVFSMEIYALDRFNCGSFVHFLLVFFPVISYAKQTFNTCFLLRITNSSFLRSQGKILV